MRSWWGVFKGRLVALCHKRMAGHSEGHSVLSHAAPSLYSVSSKVCPFKQNCRVFHPYGLPFLWAEPSNTVSEVEHGHAFPKMTPIFYEWALDGGYDSPWSFQLIPPGTFTLVSWARVDLGPSVFSLWYLP